jgi:hypothetical protein
MLTAADLTHILRVLRADRDRTVEACMLLEERLRAIGDGERVKLTREVQLCTAELAVINILIEKLWKLLHSQRH